MNTDYQYYHTLGRLYTPPGPIQFHPTNSTQLLIPTSNRITTHSLSNQSTHSTLYGHRQSVYAWAINNQGNILVTCSIHGSLSFLSYPQGIILRREKENFFPKKVRSIVFSHDDRYMLVLGGGNKLSIWATGLSYDLQQPPNALLFHSVPHIPKPTFVCSLTDAYYTVCMFGQKVIPTGNYPILLGTREGSVFLYNFEASLHRFAEKSYQCNASKHPIVYATFQPVASNSKYNPGQIHAIDSVGNYIQWQFDKMEKTFELIHKQKLPFIIQDQHKQLLITSAREVISNVANKIIIAVGTSTERFAVFSYAHSAANVKCLCDEKISSKRIVETEHKKGPNAYDPTIVALNHTGEWLAVTNGSHLLVYDYGAKTFIARQTSHHSRHIHRVAYNSEGTLLATADTYGVVKVFDSKRHQCFVTLEGHRGSVNALVFSRPPSARDPALYTASSDGTVKAWDVVRYRNFRTYVPNRDNVNFQCLAVDASGEIIVASSAQAPYNMYVWNAQTAQLISELTSHSGPITGLAFSANHQLASCSWDHTTRIWDIFAKGAPCEPIDHEREVTCLAFSPAIQSTLATGDMQGVLRFWDISAERTGEILLEIETARDWGMDKNKEGVVLTNIKWTPDGQCVLVSAKNKSFVHLYHVEQKVLLKRFQVCTNVAFANVPDPESFYMNKEKLIKDDDSYLEMSVEEIAMCPTDHEFAVATSDGVVIYRSSLNVLSENRNLNFAPLGIDVNVTPQNIYQLLREEKWIDSLIMSLRLNERTVTQRVLYSMLQKAYSEQDIDSVVLLWTRNLPHELVVTFLNFLCGELEDYQICTNVQYLILWIRCTLTTHGQFLLQESKTQSTIGASMRRIIRALSEFDHNGLRDVSTQNLFTLQYLRTFRPGLTNKIGKDI